MLHPYPFCFVDCACLRWLARSARMLVCTEATDRAETCEFLEPRLHEVEAEVEALRVDSRWNFQVSCDVTCTLGLFALLVVTILTAAWNCVSLFSLSGRDRHRWRTEERDCSRFPWRRVGTMFYTGEEVDHERSLSWPSGRISERGGARSHWVGAVSRWRRVWHRSSGVARLDLRGSKMQKRTMAGGGAGSELFPRTENCWIGYQRPANLLGSARTLRLLSQRILSSLGSLCNPKG